MILDAQLNFGLPDITNSTTKTVSPRVFDAASDKVIFGGRNRGKLKWKTVITADAAPTFLLEMWAGDAADGDVNDNEADGNEVLASTGVIRYNPVDGTVLATGDTIYGECVINPQTRARRYYGVNVTLGGTNPDIVASTSYAYVVWDAQSNMEGARAAVP